MNATRFCNDWDPAEPENYSRLNQRLAGTMSAKLTTAPYIAAPSHDLTAWKASDLTVHSHINQVTNYPEGDSGYAMPWSRSTRMACPPMPSENVFSDIFTQTLQPGIYKQAKVTQPLLSNYGISSTPQFPPESLTTIDKDNYLLFSDFSAPSHQGLKEGFAPLQPKRANFYSPSVPKPSVGKNELEPKAVRFAGPESVFDPRTTQGGGPGDASTWNYNALLGRVDHKGYDFVDSVRQPFPIVRSNVDIYDWSLGIGMHQSPQPFDSDELHQRAHNQWLDDTNAFRASLSNSLMRKRNEEMVQLRQLPIRTF